MSVNVTWTKLFVHAGVLLAAAYGVSAYVADSVEARLAGWTRTLEGVVTAQQNLDARLGQLRQAIDDQPARAAGEADRRAEVAARSLAAAQAHLEERLQALQAAVEALRPAGIPAAAPAAAAPSPAAPQP